MTNERPNEIRLDIDRSFTPTTVSPVVAHNEDLEKVGLDQVMALMADPVEPPFELDRPATRDEALAMASVLKKIAVAVEAREAGDESFARQVETEIEKQAAGVGDVLSRGARSLREGVEWALPRGLAAAERPKPTTLSQAGDKIKALWRGVQGPQAAELAAVRRQQVVESKLLQHEQAMAQETTKLRATQEARKALQPAQPPGLIQRLQTAISGLRSPEAREAAALRRAQMVEYEKVNLEALRALHRGASEQTGIAAKAVVPPLPVTQAGRSAIGPYSLAAGAATGAGGVAAYRMRQGEPK